jgi:hypothetical protein
VLGFVARRLLADVHGYQRAAAETIVAALTGVRI